MARKPISILKRPTSKKGKYTYYIKLWNENKGKYSTPRSAASIATELGLDESRYSPTSKTGALLIGQELLKRNGVLTKKSDSLFADYCAMMWDWDKSPYIQGRIARGLRIGRSHALHSKRFIENYVQPAFPSMKLSALRAYMLEKFILTLKKESGLRNRTINGIIDAIKTPLKEGVRLGLLDVDPSASLQKLGDDRRAKGIPTEKEISELLSIDLDPRIRCTIMLGAVCGLRLGEIQALKICNIERNTLNISSSWSKMEGIKSTKTEKTRIVPLPLMIKNELVLLSQINPYGREGFLIYSLIPGKPLDSRAIERSFDKALIRISLGERYGAATKKEKTEALMIWKKRNITFHSLRHFANAQLRGAVPDKTLRKLIGHISEEMTDHYDHITAADLEDLARAQETRIISFINKDCLKLN